MRRKLLFTYSILIVLAVGGALFSFRNNGYRYIYKHSMAGYMTQAQMVTDIFVAKQPKELGELKQFVAECGEKYNIRITLIQANGEVVADSEINETLENHSSRKEVVAALGGEPTTVTRYSNTLGVDCSYSAIPVATKYFDGVLRTSVTMTELDWLDENNTESFFIAILFGLLVAFITAYIFSKILSKPMEEVTQAAQQIANENYEIRIHTKDKTQIGELAQSFNQMTEKLKALIYKLKRRNIELEAIMGSMNSGVIAIDDTNSILFANHQFLDIFDTETNYIEGRRLYNVVRNAELYHVVDEVREKKAPVIQVADIISTTEKKMRITGTPLFVEDQKSFGVLLILEDMTHIYKLEGMRRDFVSNVTHELKTPLTSIRGFVETLKNGALHEEQVAMRFLDIIDIETERLSTLINDILLLSEIESKKEYDCSEIDLSKLVHQVYELLKGKVSPQVTLQVTCQKGLPNFNGNPNRMEQLLINLMDNALNYTEEGRVEVELSKQEQQLCIHVKDTGIGIPREHLERIFERFYRVDKGRSRKRGGTGLGLSIVKHIVELYHGTITVESNLGEGTTFEVRFPYE